MISNQHEICQINLVAGPTLFRILPNFNDALNVCNPIGARLGILDDGEGDVPVQQVALVIMVNVLPRESKHLNCIYVYYAF